MTLGDFWFIIDAIFWVGFFLLEGFDFGVGMLHAVLGRNDVERRVLINAIGPVWDGNEVWLIVAGAMLFAAFPGWYATMFSALYLALVLVLVALIVRGLSFEWQRKFDDPRWRSFWRWGLTVASALIPFLLGVALGDLLHGLPINSQHEYAGGFWQLLTPFGLWSGVTFVVLSLLSGATFLSLKTTGELHERAQRAATAIGVIALVVTFGFMTWVHVGLSSGFVPEPLEAVALLGVVVAAWAAPRARRRLGLHGGVRGHRGHRGVALQRAVPPGHDLEHQHRIQPDGAQHGEPALHVEGHDGDGGDLLPDRARLPGLDLPGLSATPLGAERRARRHADPGAWGDPSQSERRRAGRHGSRVHLTSSYGSPSPAQRDLWPYRRHGGFRTIESVAEDAGGDGLATCLSPTAEYGFVSGGGNHVAPGGSVLWLCPARPNSPSVFGPFSITDLPTPRHGRHRPTTASPTTFAG